MGYGIVRLLKLPKLTALTIAASLSQIGEFSFILAGLGLSQKALPQEAHDLVLAGALLSIIANPLLFAWLDRWVLRQQPGAAATQVRAAHSEVPEDIGGHAIVVGHGRVGQELSRLLQGRGVPLVLVEADNDRVEAARRQGLVTVRGNAASDAILKAARPDTAALAILAIPQALEAGEIIARLKAINPAISVLARARSEAEVKHLLAPGARARSRAPPRRLRRGLRPRRARPRDRPAGRRCARCRRTGARCPGRRRPAPVLQATVGGAWSRPGGSPATSRRRC